MSACDSGNQDGVWPEHPWVPLAPMGVVFESRQTTRLVPPSKLPPLT